MTAAQKETGLTVPELAGAGAPGCGGRVAARAVASRRVQPMLLGEGDGADWAVPA